MVVVILFVLSGPGRAVLGLFSDFSRWVDEIIGKRNNRK